MNDLAELIFMFASVVMTGMILFFVYGFRKERGVPYLIGLIVCRIVYSSSVILERSSDLLADKLVFRHLQSTALNLIVPCFLLFVYELVGRDRLWKTQWKVALFAVFALWSLLSWFDPWLHVIYRSVAIADGQLMTTRSAYSAGFGIACYALLAACLYFVFQYLRSIRGDFRRPGMWVLFLSTFPVVLEMAKLVRPDWSSWLLPFSVYCGFTGTLMLAIMLRIKFFSTVPIARNIVLDTIQESIVIANASGKIIDSNIQAAKWFSEMGHGDIDGRNMAELLEPWPAWLALCKAMKQGRTEIEVRLDGHRYVYSVTVYPLQILRKQGQGSISLIVDITEKARHLEQIAELNRLKDQLFTIVSHDIRSPLALQYQLIELLEDEIDAVDPDHREIVGKLGEQIRGTLGMTNNLLEWFRSQRDDMALRPQPLALAEVVEDGCRLLRLQSEAKRIRVSHSIAPDMRVYADREALGLIIRNLLSNAIKFTGAGGTVHVDARPSGDRVVVSVRDDGVGMGEEQVRGLFDQKRLSSLPGTSGEKGTGLGLLVSRQFAQRSGGTLWAESRPGQGSVFYFTMRSEAEG
ncbi:sensor histidine kinase [Cohnella sp. JJ-181]|uniref:sensor histidine kinase n=1 Tax=Cohnella rhizoplanae TaxID=2974897 RepID=UPI0022FFAEDA|nr:ATP-binding protein [Cohnella sp. JJ-181]CAI6060485.1 Adaptive-response sensory-kinase SasA [Cohnella sp. JJ-181]